jgi:uncharacterized membrane protein
VKYLLVPNNELLLIYAGAFWAIGYGIGWILAWALSKQKEGDYHDWQSFLAHRAAAIFFGLYLMIWLFGYVEN